MRVEDKYSFDLVSAVSFCFVVVGFTASYLALLNSSLSL